MQLPKTYDPKDYEDKIYSLWEKSGAFAAHPESNAERFTISMPPPNATGTLHVGHILGIAVQDTMIRHARMQGKDALWVPGTDHAAIATNAIMEKQLADQGTNKHQIGREEFIARLQEFIENSKNTMRSQMRAAGASADWGRERYTLDSALNRCVNETFTKMYHDGLIYRGNRIVNWDPNLETTVADDEVIRVDEVGKFYTFKYGPFHISTARPETKFGDKYVVMHPEDKRYSKYKHGDMFEADWINGKVKAMVIKDEAVDPEFGTGVMTITPWHDVTDFEIAERYGLDKQQIIDFHGKLLPIAQEFAGMHISEARPKIVEKLKAKGLLVSVDENYSHSIAVNERGKGIIEPQIKLQWFVDVNKKAVDWKGKKHSLKEVMRAVIDEQDIQILPARFNKIYFHWIDNLRDWCISRQIWWGHRIPVWYRQTTDGKETFVGVQPPVEDGKEGWSEWEQDPDTLDTWFSSALWTWSTLIDPELAANFDLSLEEILASSRDFQTYHPTDVMETSYDIIFFWVARMILATTYMTGQVPFKTVYLHGLVRAEDGQKMSKSKPETMIDPMEVIPEYGTDALRLALISGLAPGADQRFGKAKIAAQRNFCNKLWNIARYTEDKIGNDYKLDLRKIVRSQGKLARVESGLTEGEVALATSRKDRPLSAEISWSGDGGALRTSSKLNNTYQAETIADDWILTKLQQSVQRISHDLDNYSFSEAFDALYHFVWDDFADWYIEVSKTHLNKGVLAYCLETILKLAHPFAPFVTEAIWQTIHSDSLLITSAWPEVTTTNKHRAADFEKLIGLITELRNLSATAGLIKPDLLVSTNALLSGQTELVKRLAKLGNITEVEEGQGLKLANQDFHAWLNLTEETRKKVTEQLANKLAAEQGSIKNLEARLANKSYVDNAPEKLVTETKQQLEQARNTSEELETQIALFN